MNPLLQPGLHGAFVLNGYGLPMHHLGSDGSGALAAVRLAVKDVFEIDGLVCHAGHPQWGRGKTRATQHADAVQWLLLEGCQWVGKTVSDELTYSLAGINIHYGTPVNPRAPDRLPGGSSSGSAVAVAGGHAELALGTDCGGSIRLPASYCGLWGMRPSHGRISAGGCFTLAHSFDTVGWFARSGALLQAAFNSLAHSRSDSSATPRLLISDDVLGQLDPAVKSAFEHCLDALGRPLTRLPVGTLDLVGWAEAFRVLQSSEIWQQHAQWITSQQPLLGADVAGRFRQASAIQAEQVAAASRVRSQAVACLNRVLGDDGLLVLPPVPGVAPLLAAPAEVVQDTRTRSQRLLCMAGLAGLPQVVMPWLDIEGAPVGLSVMGPRFADEWVLGYALSLHADEFAEHS